MTFLRARVSEIVRSTVVHVWFWLRYIKSQVVSPSRTSARRVTKKLLLTDKNSKRRVPPTCFESLFSGFCGCHFRTIPLPVDDPQKRLR